MDYNEQEINDAIEFNKLEAEVITLRKMVIVLEVGGIILGIILLLKW